MGREWALYTVMPFWPKRIKEGKAGLVKIRIVLKRESAFYCGQMLLKILERERYKANHLWPSHNFFRTR